MARGTKHPVRDFLFTYYSYRPALLLRWSPGPDVLLAGATAEQLGWGHDFTATPEGLVLRASDFPAQRRSFVTWACDYLQRTGERTPLFGCFGLHEWAMVYREPNIRHEQTPLRLSAEAIAHVVESEQLCCTHYDAYRFFSAAAVPLNTHRLSRMATNEFDQWGCVHVTMDLYRYAYKIAPWVASSLLAETFLLAYEARLLDMQASPYDLQEYGLTPIAIETPQGKEEYVTRQRQLADQAQPLRARLLDVYQQLRDSMRQTPD